LRSLTVILIFFLAFSAASGQRDSIRHRSDSLPDRFYVLQNVERNGEKLPEIEIKEVTISGNRKKASAFQAWRYERLVYNVKKVYPYALIVRDKLRGVSNELEKLPDDKARRRYIKDVERQIFHDYEDEISQMSISQGKLLIRLIDRETSNTSYEIIKEYRGSFSASFWQGIARLFGTNLKEEYDPFGDDFLIEKIIQEIEEGRL
jgi:hypothetical protein